MKPTLSVIIPTWNTSLITLKCINTLKKFLPSGYAQIIIVDNGSTDDTPQSIGNLKTITYIRNSDNLGFSKANNIGAKKATGKFLLFLNSDMELIDGSLVEMVNYFKNHSNIGLIGPRFLNPDLTPQGSVLPAQTVLNAFKQYWLNISAYNKYTPKSEIPIQVENISGGAVLILKSDFNKIGGWDERYYFYFEDLELCRQIKKINKQVFYYPKCTVIHRHGASGTNVKNASNQWRRLIPSSILYHGPVEYYLIFLITWSSQKFRQIFS